MTSEITRHEMRLEMTEVAICLDSGIGPPFQISSGYTTLPRTSKVGCLKLLGKHQKKVPWSIRKFAAQNMTILVTKPDGCHVSNPFKDPWCDF